MPNQITDKILQFIATLFSGVTREVLLWENAIPGSAFVSQTVSMDLSGFDYVRVIAANGISTAAQKAEKEEIIRVGRKATIVTQPHYLRYRTCEVTPTGITFDSSYEINLQSTAAAYVYNDYVIPLKIFAGKVVS